MPKQEVKFMAKQKKKRGELLWPRMMMKKWLNISSTAGDEFSADEHEDAETDTESEADSEYQADHMPAESSDRVSYQLSLSKDAGHGDPNEGRASTRLRRGQSVTLPREYLKAEELQIAVGTWNVAGRTPSPGLELQGWLQANEAADIYVIGFQEIVPLNAGNVFGSEDNGPTLKWQALIRETLNKAGQRDANKSYSAPPSPNRDMESESSDILVGNGEIDAERIFIDEETSFSDMENSKLHLELSKDTQDGQEGVFRSTECIGLCAERHLRTQSEPISFSLHSSVLTDEESTPPSFSQRSIRSNGDPPPKMYSKSHAKKRVRYVRVASKQMVGIHISVWVRRKLRRYIHNLAVSCVGLGIMGCMGNKGSISVSMTLHDTSFCFVCTHLTSGDKEGDEMRRNADVMEIFKRTRFPGSKRADAADFPKTTIMAHDQIIWLGDLNYRLNLSEVETWFLVAREDWTALLRKDQLKEEMLQGHIFHGWCEGPIDFPPTYKYEMNSTKYAGENAKSGDKRRAPAWCDRILWLGKGLQQLSYRRHELLLSDHRPVMALFLAEVEVFSERKFRKALPHKTAKYVSKSFLRRPGNTSVNSNPVGLATSYCARNPDEDEYSCEERLCYEAWRQTPQLFHGEAGHMSVPY